MFRNLDLDNVVEPNPVIERLRKEWHLTALFCCEDQISFLVTEGEYEFASNLFDNWRGQISEKQAKWLLRIFYRLLPPNEPNCWQPISKAWRDCRRDLPDAWAPWGMELFEGTYCDEVEEALNEAWNPPRHAVRSLPDNVILFRPRSAG